jgi:predicted RNA-binding protein with RPS1 domain
MEEAVNNYINEVLELPEFKRLVELKILIDDKYSKEILAFKTTEEKYNEAKKYPNNYDINTIRDGFIKAKSNLYSKAEVKEYFDLENHIQDLLNNDFNRIKDSIINTDKIRCNRLK